LGKIVQVPVLKKPSLSRRNPLMSNNAPPRLPAIGGGGIVYPFMREVSLVHGQAAIPSPGLTQEGLSEHELELARILSR
jgi:hypothetical protein